MERAHSLYRSGAALGLFCECTHAHYLLWKAKISLSVYEAEKLFCYVVLLIEQGFLIHFIAPHFVNNFFPSWCLHPSRGCIGFLSLTAPSVKRYIRNPSSVASPSRRWCALLLFFELLCLCSFWKCETWRKCALLLEPPSSFTQNGLESLWFLPAPCHSGFGLSHSTLRFHV